MDRIFKNSSTPAGFLDPNATGDIDAYDFMVKALIDDTIDFEQSELAPERQQSLEYYDAVRPGLESEDDAPITGDPPSDDDATANRSSVVSSDVRDTILSIIPSLMRIFAGSEHAVEFAPNSADQAPMAKQATDYVRWKIWHQNDGFTLLYDAFWDALTTRLGIFTWGTSIDTKKSVKTFNGVTEDQLAQILSAKELSPSILSYDPPIVVEGIGQVINNLRVQYEKSVPNTWVDSVAPEDFRISRNAKSAKLADCIGYEEIKRISDLVEMGYDLEEVTAQAGISYPLSADRQLRQPSSDMMYPLNDLVQYGCFWIRIDSDGDGINELHNIHTIGENHAIIADEIVDSAPFGLVSADRRPHYAIGGSFTSLVMDIQRIKTGLIRGGLDSLAQSIFPRTAFNELLVNTEDIMSDDISAPIRVRGNPAELIQSTVTPFVGQPVFDAAGYLDQIRVARTGISDASKGLDPKIFQSTNLSGIDAIVQGAQERIELIARIFAETGIKAMYEGLLEEITSNPNRAEIIQISGNWIEVNPSLYDASMRVVVNPMLGKGSDQTRLMALQSVAAAQNAVVQNYGFGNGVVGPVEMRNTQVDILELVNIRNPERYFRAITPEQAQAIETAPKTPSPEMLLAQSQLENVKSKTAVAVGKQQQDAEKLQQQKDHQTAETTSKAISSAAQLKFQYDNLHTQSYVQLVGFLKDAVLAAGQPEDEVMNLSPEK